MGTVDSVTLTLDGIGIYGDGTPDSVPVLPKDDADVYAMISVTPDEVYFDGFAYAIGNMTVLSGEIVTTAIDALPTETLATFAPVTGALTAGTYYYWICRIEDEEVADVASPFTRNFSGFLGVFGKDGLSVGMFEPGIGNTDPDVNFV